MVDKDYYKMISGFVGLIVLFAIGIMSFAIYKLIQDENARYFSKFQVGDCVAQVFENEFYSKTFYHKIVKVGKESYLTSVGMGQGTLQIENKNVEYKYRFNEYEKVDRKNCDVGIIVYE